MSIELWAAKRRKRARPFLRLFAATPERRPQMIYVIATIEVAEGKRDAFLAEFHKLVPKVHAEAGCLEYGPTVDVPTGPAPQQRRYHRREVGERRSPEDPPCPAAHGRVQGSDEGPDQGCGAAGAGASVEREQRRGSRLPVVMRGSGTLACPTAGERQATAESGRSRRRSPRRVDRLRFAD